MDSATCAAAADGASPLGILILLFLAYHIGKANA